ncbi:MAG TPA: TPM domain-containing protein [Terriglobales bacterium]|nr:TPM domain-containing protein [Terriglobales bacterium]
MLRARFGIILFALLWSGVSRAEKIADIHPRGYVTDLAGIIDPDSKQKLEALAYEVEQKTGAQIGVVTVKSLEGESIEEYAVDLYKHLGIGSKKNDRGVLLLIAPPERRYRVEVGYGLEGVITDARAGDVGRSMVPFLRQNNYSAAVTTAVDQLAQLIAADKGVSLNGVVTERAPPAQDSGMPFWVILLIIFGIFIVLKIFAHSGRNSFRGGRRGPGFFWFPPMGGGWGGGGFGGSSGGFSGGGGFGGFGGGMSGGGGASGGW